MAKVKLEQLQKESRNRHIDKDAPIVIKRRGVNRLATKKMQEIDWFKVKKFASK